MIFLDYEALHGWDLSPKEAVELQRVLKSRIILKPFERVPKIVAGVDLSFPRRDVALSVVVLVEYPSLKLISYVYSFSKVSFPYVPGLLVFREGPAFLNSWKKLKTKPDLVIFDGQGIAHPRGIGIASHMGLFINLPTIGVAKSRLYGKHEELPDEEWAATPLISKNGEVIGYAVRTRKGSKPIFISPGHLTDLDSALKLTKMMTVKGRKLPEPTRLAHLLTQKLKKEFLGDGMEEIG